MIATIITKDINEVINARVKNPIFQIGANSSGILVICWLQSHSIDDKADILLTVDDDDDDDDDVVVIGMILVLMFFLISLVVVNNNLCFK